MPTLVSAPYHKEVAKEMKNKITIALLIVGLLSIAAWTGKGQTDKVRSVSYEYQVLADPTAWRGTEVGIKQLNELGSQGWELAGVVQEGNAPPMLYFKRVKRVL